MKEFIVTLRKNRGVRAFGVLVSILFIAGAAFNDGFTGWALGIPFIIFFYFLLTVSRKISLSMCVGIFLLMVIISNYKWTSSFVYPVLGSEVFLLNDIPTLQYGDSVPNFDIFLGENIGCSGCPPTQQGLILKGKPFAVERIEATHSDFSLDHNFILSNGSERFSVSDSMLHLDIETQTGTFCSNVEWNFCAQSLSNGTSEADPMRPAFRALTALMYYPIPPLLVVSLVSSFQTK